MALIFNGLGPVVGVQGNMCKTPAFMHNPLLSLVKAIVCDSTASHSEYDILKKLTARDVFSQLSGDASTVLFQKHFLLMNALYQLRDECIAQDSGVVYISVLKIQYVPRITQDFATPKPCDTLVSLSIDDKGADEKLRVYYLDMNNLATSATDIDTMLAEFWRKFSKWQNQVSNDLLSKSFQELDIAPSASFEHVQKTYRMLVAKHHPDRGGDAKKFIAIRHAYDIISSTLQ